MQYISLCSCLLVHTHYSTLKILYNLNVLDNIAESTMVVFLEVGLTGWSWRVADKLKMKAYRVKFVWNEWAIGLIWCCEVRTENLIEDKVDLKEDLLWKVIHQFCLAWFWKLFCIVNWKWFFWCNCFTRQGFFIMFVILNSFLCSLI